ncbi:Metalloenzyme, LuxS/M16 peptidase-like protein [Lactarius akahatsu]|uniref:Metalloenzyme, LuxS/M16 peptidase-like protein n=1 Tax=Lactarius akahatsu TaxID=416441 RepID=A0AAD4QCL7_9AGAM|nr:Metalloenzyme, LuxS/M16 peptidase-like protein [Lactarius akahatsu]
MNRLLSCLRRRPTTPTSASLFPISRPRLASTLQLQHSMSPTLYPPNPSTPSSPRETFGNFDLIRRVKLDFTDVTVSSWRSRVTGLSVVHLDYEAPIVNGYFVVATEIFNDTGCPHTLEHLVFMGSEKYPYKGIIDHFANRGLSNGTNAWTDTDHTAYTVSTAGEAGFLQILPIYVDHILYPTITDAGFLTEVHHIDPQGEDSGVVYSEMQGRENTSGDLMSLEAQRLVNPLGSAYRSETGGLMEALRKLTVEQIREYHKTYYVPHNLSLIVAGKLSSGTETLLSVVQNKIEPSIIAHGQDKGPKPAGWNRPFLETPSALRTPMKELVEHTVEFPEKDESSGELIINFMGPRTDDLLESAPHYDSGSRDSWDISHATLTACSTYIYFGEESRATLCDVMIYVGSVPTEHLDTFDAKLHESFRRISKEGVDLDRMSMVIDRAERQFRSKVESDGGDAFSSAMIANFLYGRLDGSQIEDALDEIKDYNALRTWSSKQWSDIINKYFVDPKRIVVRGRPSAAVADRIEKEEKARIAKQKEALGPEGLARKAKELEEAKAEHDNPIPTEILKSFPVPDVKSISWIPVQSVQQAGTGRKGRAPSVENDVSRHVNADGVPLPFFVQYDHVKSDFVSIHAYLSLSKLPSHLRPYIQPYLSSFFSLPVKRQSGERLSHEEVVDQLDDQTVSYDVSLGISGRFTETMRVTIRVEVAKYELAVAWLRDLLYGSEFAKERLQITAAQIQQALPGLKRDGSTVLSAVSSELLYASNSTTRASGVLIQSDFIPTLAEKIHSSPEEVIQLFEHIREHITDPSGIRFSVTGNVLSIPKPRSVWNKYFGTVLPNVPLLPVPLVSDTLSEVGKNPVKQAIVVTLPTIESSFVNHVGKGDYPALRVASEVLSATESFLWRYIRGSGLAYGAYIGVDLEAGSVTFSLYRSSNSLEAFKQGAAVVRGLVDGSIVLDETALDAAKSTIVFGVTKSVSTPGRAAVTSFTNQALKGVPQNHNIELLEKFQQVSKDDVLQVLRQYFLPLFDSSTSVVVSVTAPGKADEISKGLKDAGFVVERRALELELEDGSEHEDESESGSEGDRSH